MYQFDTTYSMQVPTYKKFSQECTAELHSYL